MFELRDKRQFPFRFARLKGKNQKKTKEEERMTL
jgi:hypothetical protein